MQSFLNKIGKTAGAAANKAGSKANELLEIGKLKGKISTEKQNIKATKAAIGDYCYDLFQQDCIDNEKIREYCEKIRVYEDNIADLQQQISDVRAGAADEDQERLFREKPCRRAIVCSEIWGCLWFRRGCGNRISEP